ncbi:MAG: hypothetical protein PHR87_11790 [Sulfurospirillaceae bacterium]|nr:hypothetical protein [Sulfurospirillaceae bacterium]
MRKAFGLIQALIVIVMISGIMTIAMKYATISVKQTSDAYAKESAELFMDSAVELTLLAISGYDRNTSNHCLKDVNITSADGRYLADVNITTYYLLGGSADCTNCGALCTPIQTEESHGMVMLEVVVETNNTNPRNDQPIRLIRRTLQRP